MVGSGGGCTGGRVKGVLGVVGLGVVLPVEVTKSTHTIFHGLVGWVWGWVSNGCGITIGGAN